MPWLETTVADRFHHRHVDDGAAQDRRILTRAPLGPTSGIVPAMRWAVVPVVLAVLLAGCTSPGARTRGTYEPSDVP